MNLSARRVDLVGGSPFWPTVAGDATRYSEVTSDVVCEVAVVGGGITGALVAASLVKEGISVALVDQGRFGGESTCASTAMISYDFDETLIGLSKLRTPRIAERSYELCYQAVSELKQWVRFIDAECDYESKVALRIDSTGHRGNEFDAEFKAREKLGLKVESLDRDTLLRRFGIAAHRGLVAPNAAQIDPLRFTRLLIEWGATHGLLPFETTRVRRVVNNPIGVTLTTDKGWKMRARNVVFATGYASEKYLPQPLALLTTDFCVASNPTNVEELERCHFVEQVDNYLYASSYADRFIVGIQEGRYLSPAARKRALKKRTARLLQRASTALPHHNLEAEFMWAATFARSADSLPYLLAAPNLSGCYFVLGYGGNGIASSAMLAPLVRDLVLGRENKDARLFTPERG